MAQNGEEKKACSCNKHYVIESPHQAVAPVGKDYVENNLVQFVHILRHMGLRVSTAEVIDTFRALDMVDLLDMPQTKATLQATLAKDPQSKKLFETAFDAFFVPPEKKKARHDARLEIQEQKAKMIEASHEELSYSIDDYGQEAQSEEMQVELSPEDRDTYAGLPQDIKDKFKEFLNKNFQKNPINAPKSLMDNLVKGYLNYWKRFLQNQDLIKNPPVDVQMTGEDEVDEVLEEVMATIKDDNQLLYEDMSNILDKDVPKASQLIRRLAHQLATRISRRYRRSKKRQRIDVRRTIRQNIRFGGTLLSLQYKTRRVEKPNLLLICDVSGSMARYASFVLQFIYGLASVVERIESFVFSEDVERVTPYFAEDRPFEETMVGILNRSEAWGKGTDFGKAVKMIRQRNRELLRSDTFVIIVSDTKTIGVERARAELAGLKEKVKEIIWLNTAPRREWKSIPAVAAFKKYVTMYECSTLAHLDKILRTQLTH